MRNGGCLNRVVIRHMVICHVLDEIIQHKDITTVYC